MFTILNNKGYMLIEMILASVIAFTIAYFAIDMTINIKNKNDDLLVETQAATDQAIIVNELSKIATESRINLDILKINGNEIIYDKKTIDKVNEYVTVDNIKKENTNGKLNLVIPLSVKQLENKNFDVVISMRDGARINGLTVIQDGMTGHGPSVTATLAVDDTSKVKSYEWKISTNNICNSSVTGFTSTNKNSTFNNKLTSFGKYYVCAKMIDNTGNAQYIVSDQIDFSMQLADYVSYTSSTTSNTTVSKCTLYNPSTLNVWRIIRKNNNGTIDIISDGVISGCKLGSPNGASDYNSYSDILTNVAKKFENSSYTVGSRYPKDDAEGTTLIKTVLGTLKSPADAGYFINSKKMEGNDHMACMEWGDGKIHYWSFDEKWYQTNFRPIVILKNGLKYKSGNGTKNSPYVLVP